MKSFQRFFLPLSLAIALMLLTSCGGGGGGGGGSASTVISGKVFDDAIVGATVTATSLSTNQVLGTAITGTDGSFILNVTTSQVGSGYSLTSSGGTMNGQPFTGSLSAIYPATANSQQSNLTLITSALSVAANNQTQISGTLLDNFNSVTTNAIARGLIPANYSDVQPAGMWQAALQNIAATSGPSTAINGLAQLIGSATCVSGATCADVVSLSQDRTLSLQNGATVTLSAGALSNCHVVASYDATAQSITMHLENITSSNSTAPITCSVSGNGNVTLSLPAPGAEVPGACLPPSSRATSMSNCVTIGSGITPSYFLDDGNGHNHRTNNNPNFIPLPSTGLPVKFSRSYGAVLNSSEPPSSGSALNQWAGKTPVIFVHGFALGGGFGGDDGTWGKLPNLVTEDPNVVALNFQWITDANYLTVVSELAKAVDYAYLSTGNKVHIVAHSFGGVLSRVMLQNLNGATGSSAAHVATLTTVGTPHSGIVKATGGATVENKALPQGWGSWVPDSRCAQISCYQSGLDANIAQWAKNELRCPAGIPLCAEGSVPAPGYINARLADFTNHAFPSGLKVNVLIGQIIDNRSAQTFWSGDGLIAYSGQRFIPQGGRNALLSDSDQGGAKVTERILGLPSGTDAYPGDSVGSPSPATTYMKGPTNSPYFGYRHSSRIATTVTGGVAGDVFNSEVNVPDSCSSALTCQHDTWLDLKEFWQANLNCPSGQVIQNGQCVTSAYTITEFSAGITPSAYLLGITAGHDGNLWFAEYSGGSRIGRITPNGVVTEFNNGLSSFAEPTIITAGSDGNVWFAESGYNGSSTKIGQITPAGAISEFDVGYGAHGISAGPDGNLWVPQFDMISRVTTGGTYTVFPILHSFENPSCITSGSDGNLWYTMGANGFTSTIGRITPAGVITEFGTSISSSGGFPCIAAGPDGNIWFTDNGDNLIGRLTPSGVFTQFSTGISAGAHPYSITAGPDGNIWFTEPGINGIGRITPSGIVTEFTAGISVNASPTGIAAGPDGNIWFTETGINSIGRITLNAPAVPTGVSAVAGLGKVTISWNAVAGATSYNLYAATVSGVTKYNYSSLSGGIKITGVTSPYIQTGLTNGTPYYFVVTAVNANGESNESSHVSATPHTPVFGEF